MRMYRTSNRSRDFHQLSPRDFPEVFAVCRNIYPSPQFQVLGIRRVSGYDEYAIYKFENVPIENTEVLLIHEGNPEERDYGEMNLIRQRNLDDSIRADSSIRIRFEIPRVYLVSRFDNFPVVLIDNFQVLPPIETVLIPRNGRENLQHAESDPYSMMNYLLNRNHFLPPNINDLHDRFNRHNREDGFHGVRRHMRTRRNSRSWYEDIDRVAVRRFLAPDEIMQEEEDVPFPRVTRILHRGNSVAAGGGAGSGQPVQLQAAARPQTPQRAPQPAGVLTLQAFTIQALIKHAIAENMTCPISMNPIEEGTACITSCQHIFDRDSITRWLGDHTNCPVCRQATTICN